MNLSNKHTRIEECVNRTFLFEACAIFFWWYAKTIGPWLNDESIPFVVVTSTGIVLGSRSVSVNNLSNFIAIWFTKYAIAVFLWPQFEGLICRSRTIWVSSETVDDMPLACINNENLSKYNIKKLNPANQRMDRSHMVKACYNRQCIIEQRGKTYT